MKSNVLYIYQAQTTQTLAYLPYGGLRSNREYNNSNKYHEQHWVNLVSNNPLYETTYKYNGKEKDDETGYNYYGARYYSSDLPIWLSVDPLSDKYPSLSPYVYCANNPIMLIDPDGRRIDHVFNTSGQYIGETPTGNNIVIANSVADANRGKSMLLSKYLSMSGKRNASLILGAIASYYAKDVVRGNNNGILATNYQNINSPAYTVEKSQIYFNLNFKLLNYFNNAANIESLVFHENLHQLDKNSTTNYSHAEIYLQQILDNTFSGTTDQFKQRIIESFASFCEGAANEDGKRISLLIDRFNYGNIYGYLLKVKYNEKREAKIKLFKSN